MTERTRDISEANEGPTFRNWSTKADFAWIALMILMMFGIANFWDLERGMTAACSGAAIIILTRFCAYLWGRFWFWVLIGLFVVLHVFVVIYLPWARNELPAAALMPLGFVDFGIMYLCVRMMRRLMQ